MISTIACARAPVGLLPKSIIQQEMRIFSVVSSDGFRPPPPMSRPCMLHWMSCVRHSRCVGASTRPVTSTSGDGRPVVKVFQSTTAGNSVALNSTDAGSSGLALRTPVLVSIATIGSAVAAASSTSSLGLRGSSLISTFQPRVYSSPPMPMPPVQMNHTRAPAACARQGVSIALRHTFSNRMPVRSSTISSKNIHSSSTRPGDMMATPAKFPTAGP